MLKSEPINSSIKAEKRVMGRKNTYHEKLQKYDFKKLYKHEKSPEMRIRLLGLLHMQAGKSYREVADMLGVNISTPKRWIRRFVEEGVDGLSNKPGRGRKRMLPEEKNNTMKDAVLNMQEKLRGGRIIGKDVLKMMNKKFDVQCSLTTVYNTLHRVGCSWITPRPKHPKSSLAEQDAFKKNLNLKSL
jgi:transposase